MQRRTFLKHSCAAALISAFPQHTLSGLHLKSKLLKSIGIQLFSLPKLLESSFEEGIRLLAEMGYREIELYGPYSFSAQSAKDRWNAITPMLGFSGSGFFGHTLREIRTILKKHSIKATAMHTDLETLNQHMDQLGEAAARLGVEFVGIPAIPEEKRGSLEDYQRMAVEFNSIGEKAKNVGVKFSYHNHGYGLQELQGQIPFNVILEQTDPQLVFFEMDLYWTTAGGADPVEYLQAYPNRFRLMHVKDMREKVRFSGDGGSPKEWMELFPYMTTVGDGVLDLSAILPVAKRMGVKHFYVEQDMVANPQVALKRSIDYLKSL
ncbi:MAG: sugar phosphate isomerase/epimerase [Cyclobacteriaceae bacterium]|nr:sugar phosphate isomerase/epimerase [Cyclobacteriaceae bacterium]